MTNGPSLDGSPSSRAILAPRGSDGGPSCHLMVVGVTMTSCFLSAGWAPTVAARNRAAREMAVRRDAGCMACSCGHREGAAGIVFELDGTVTVPAPPTA